MGHAGAIASGGKGTAEGKFAAMEKAGVTTVKSPGDLGAAIAKRLNELSVPPYALLMERPPSGGLLLLASSESRALIRRCDAPSPAMREKG